MFEQYIGIPYVKRAATMSACDCLGLFKLVYADRLGVILPDYIDCDMSDAQDILNTWRFIQVPEVYDMLLFSNAEDGWHVGMHAGNNMMLHTTDGKMSCLERYNRPYWSGRFAGAYRWAM